MVTFLFSFAACPDGYTMNEVKNTDLIKYLDNHKAGSDGQERIWLRSVSSSNLTFTNTRCISCQASCQQAGLPISNCDNFFGCTNRKLSATNINICINNIKFSTSKDCIYIHWGKILSAGWKKSPKLNEWYMISNSNMFYSFICNWKLAISTYGFQRTVDLLS